MADSANSTRGRHAGQRCFPRVRVVCVLCDRENCLLLLTARLGLGWGNSLLGFVALASIPLPILLMRYGKWARDRWQVGDLGFF